MKITSTSGSVFRCIVLTVLVLFGAAAAGVSKVPIPSHTRSSIAPSPTSTASLCSKHPVQCCAAVAESNSTTASSVLGLLGVTVPKKTVEIGYNCTSISDEDVKGGFCDNSILCCQKIYNGTVSSSVNSTVGVNCTDVAV